MNKIRLAKPGLLLALVLVLGACGRAQSAGTVETPSPSASPSSLPTEQASPLTIPGPAFHKGEVGLVYAPVKYTATGGTDAYLWTVSGGALPGGLTLSQDGTISGTPTAAGTFSFTVQVTDAAMATANVAGQITVVSRLTYRYLNGMLTNNTMSVCTSGGKCPGCLWLATPPSCPQTPQDDHYRPFAAVGGGAAPYTYSVISGSLPPQTHLSGLALAGTYVDAKQVFQFTVRVTDSLGAVLNIPVVYTLYFTNAG